MFSQSLTISDLADRIKLYALNYLKLLGIERNHRSRSGSLCLSSEGKKGRSIVYTTA